MKSLKPILTCLLVFLSFFTKANILAGNIAWECQGNYQYCFMVDLYVDTTLGSAQFTKETLQIQTTCGSINLALKQYAVKNLAPTCDTLRSVCAGNDCYKKVRLVGVSDLSSYVNNGCCEFDLSFQSYVRTQKITTGAASLGFYVDAVLNTCNVACHSSPIWEREAIIVSRVQGDSYKLGATLNHTKAQFTFELNAPRSKVGTTTFWSSGRSYTSPLAHRTFLLGKFTGRLAVEPTGSARSIMAYKLLIKRNGVYLGEITREVYLHVDNLANTAPVTSLQYAVGSNDYSDVSIVCGGETKCYTIAVYDNDTTDSIAMALTQNPGYINYSATYTTASKMRGLYCFAPDTLQAPGIDTFQVTVKDNFCTPNIPKRRLYRVLVRERKHFEPVLNANKQANCGLYTFSVFRKNTQRTEEDIQWFIDGKEVPNTNYGPRGHSDSLVYNFVNNGTYTVKAIIHSCPRKEVQRTVQVSGLDEISILNTTDTTTCLSPLTMKLRASGGQKPYTYSIPNERARNARFLKSDATVLFLDAYVGLDKDSVVYRVSDANGCYVDQQIRVNYEASTETRTDLGQLCGPVDSLLNFPKRTVGNWYNDSLLNQQAVGLKDLSLGYHYWYHSNEDVLNCEHTRLTFYIDLKPEASILDSAFSICRAAGFTKQLKTRPAGGIWLGARVSIEGSVDVLKLPEGMNPIVYITQATNGCSNSDTLFLTVKDYVPTLVMPDSLFFCAGSDELFELVALPKGGEWNGPGMLTTDGIEARATQLIQGSNVYTYGYTDSLGCEASARSIVFVNPLPGLVFDVTSGIVEVGDSIEVENGMSDSAFTVQWFVDGKLVSTSNAKTFNILPEDTGFFVLKAVATNAKNQCADSMERSFFHDFITGIAPSGVLGLKVYPNPTRNLLYLEGLPTGTSQVSIRSMDGKEVRHMDGVPPRFIDVSALPKGLYYVQLQTGDSLQNTLFVKE